MSQRKPNYASVQEGSPKINQFSTQKIKTSPMHKDKPSIIFQSTPMNNNTQGQFKAPVDITPRQMLNNQTHQGSKHIQKVPSMNSMEFKSMNLKNSFSAGQNNSLMNSVRLQHGLTNSQSITRVQNVAANIPSTV